MGNVDTIGIETAHEPNAPSPDRVREALLGIPYMRTICQVQKTMRFAAFAVVSPGTLTEGKTKSVRIVDTRGEWRDVGVPVDVSADR